jgi:hypothetical protein
MSRNPLGSALYRESALLSQKVSEADPFFQEIALMGVDDRVKYAILKTIINEGLLELDIPSMSLDDMIEKIMIPLIQRVGQARFKADPLTHLGMKVGSPKDSMAYQR